MQESGHLAALPDEALRLTLGRLFEREYKRRDIKSRFCDQLGSDLAFVVLPTHTDRINNRPMGNRAESLAALRNGIIPSATRAGSTSTSL